METVYTSTTKRDCLRYALVLEALGIRHVTRNEAGGFTIAVAASDAAWARSELDSYAREHKDWHVRVDAFPVLADGWAGVVGYVAVLVIVTVFDHRDAFALDWFSAGKTHAGLVRDGQWWRTLTALTLHTDLTHLFANLVIGGLFGLFAGQLLGSGLAWVSILTAGAAGNLLNAWIRQPAHTSVGASTAVFAALGLVAAYVWMRRGKAPASKLRRWRSLVGGAVLLAFLGTGGERTDVTAHVAGFLCGLSLGAVYGKLGDRILLGAKAQLILGFVALGLLILAWKIALA